MVSLEVRHGPPDCNAQNPAILPRRPHHSRLREEWNVPITLRCGTLPLGCLLAGAIAQTAGAQLLNHKDLSAAMAITIAQTAEAERLLARPADTSRDSTMTFTERSFRDALGLFPTGVAVVTTITKDGTRIGATVSSFNSVSLLPPLVLFSIARTSNSFAAWSDAETYAINILHEHQHAVSKQFARTLTEKWEGTVPLAGHTGTLLIPGALASFECENYARYDGGDHLILVGKVCAVTTTTASDPRPLIFYRGSYQKIERDYDSKPPTDFYYLLNGW